jgi:hypothetical protein
MLHACVQRFDVTGTVQKFLGVFRHLNRPWELCPWSTWVSLDHEVRGRFFFYFLPKFKTYFGFNLDLNFFKKLARLARHHAWRGNWTEPRHAWWRGAGATWHAVGSECWRDWETWKDVPRHASWRGTPNLPQVMAGCVHALSHRVVCTVVPCCCCTGPLSHRVVCTVVHMPSLSSRGVYSSALLLLSRSRRELTATVGAQAPRRSPASFWKCFRTIHLLPAGGLIFV